MQLITKVLLAFCGLLSGYAQGQSVFNLEFSPNIIAGNVGSTVAVELIATQFTDIAGFQFALAYDNTKIKIVTADIPNNSTLENWNFFPPTGNINIFSTNHIKFSWNDPSDLNNTLTPNSVLCTLIFEILSVATTGICVNPLEQPLPLAFGQGNETAEFVSFTCANMTNTNQPNQTNHLSLTVAPNPIVETAAISFNALESAPVEINIINTLGQNCWQRSMTAQAGENKISIDRTQFPTTGLYYITLQHATGRTAYPIWVQ
jgi:Cohesin domain/Secretion system C-terminal sorting domain